MSTRLTTAEWVQKARELWGEAYDYSKVEYKTAKTPVEVVCPTHGSWFPLPTNHVRASSSKGCPACRGGVAKPFAEFMQEATSLHSGQYEYDEHTYGGATTPLRIICSEHGEFWQAPHVHLRGSGCSLCSKARSMLAARENSCREVGRRIHALSNGSVRLVAPTFTGINGTANFVCSAHGPYERLVNTALHSKHPCVNCSSGKRSVRPTGEVILELRKRWPEYEVEPFEHTGKSTRVTLLCSKHGHFSLLVGSIYRSPGCPRCATAHSKTNRSAGLRKANEATLDKRAADWLSKAREVHGDEYDYSDVQYTTARSPVQITCSRHGTFRQPPSTHLQAGCRRCADEELKGLYSERYFQKNPQETTREALIYYLQLRWKSERFFKVGITRTTLGKRFGLLASNGVQFDAISTRRTTLLDAFESEQIIIEEHVRGCPFAASTAGLVPRVLRLGASECFTAPLKLKRHLELVGAC